MHSCLWPQEILAVCVCDHNKILAVCDQRKSLQLGFFFCWKNVSGFGFICSDSGFFFFFLLVCFATERLKELNKLLEDVARTAISTGPRGAIRLAQGIEAVVSVGSEYLLQLYRVFFLCSLLSSLPHHLIPFITVCVHLRWQNLPMNEWILPLGLCSENSDCTERQRQREIFASFVFIPVFLHRHICRIAGWCFMQHIFVW